ncbi:MAG TPA: class I SAM-dependent methyltransferase [Acidimicrobiales bacterium]|nr:class I SAM-dependent methyltransferase [Acidimicrobiales bacterium]
MPIAGALGDTVAVAPLRGPASHDSTSVADGTSLIRSMGRAGLSSLPDPLRRRVQALRGKPLPRVVTLDGLDRELDEARRLFDHSEDAARQFLRGFEIAPPTDRPDDPFSDDYRGWVWELYERISGRRNYSTANESSPFDVEHALRQPYPHATESSRVVGEELIARGFIIKTMGLAPPARIVEFGPGWGNLTIDLATMGFDVTGVEVEPQFCALVEQRCPRPERLTMRAQDMLSFDPDDPFDAAIFYESFHHCADHLAMLDHLHGVVGPDGVVVFAAEPIAAMAYPWGPRLDGYSLWSTRVYGWLELGFDDAYFTSALERTGWEAKRFRALDRSPLADVLLVRPR